MIYLDSAATSLLKPPEVSRAAAKAMGELGSPGRGTHAPAMKAAEILFSCREEAAGLFHMGDPTGVIFTMNATHGINLAVHSLVSPGMRAVMSGYEHNAVVRPLYSAGAIMDRPAPAEYDPLKLLDFYRSHLPGAGCAVCTHVSNVFGFVEPLEEIAALCRQYRVPLIVDAAQSAGILDLDFQALGADYMAMPGHKGLLGPQGTGLLLCRKDAEPLLLGGTGSYSLSLSMPEELPDRLEAGTQNVCGIAGLLEGLRYVRRNGHAIRKKERDLTDLLRRGLSRIRGLRVIFSEKPSLGVISVLPETMSCEELGERLGRAGVAVRSGLHCAPEAHRTMGTLNTGTVRFSVSPFNTPGEIESSLRITEKILENSNKM